MAPSRPARSQPASLTPFARRPGPSALPRWSGRGHTPPAAVTKRGEVSRYGPASNNSNPTSPQNVTPDEQQSLASGGERNPVAILGLLGAWRWRRGSDPTWKRVPLRGPVHPGERGELELIGGAERSVDLHALGRAPRRSRREGCHTNRRRSQVQHSGAGPRHVVTTESAAGPIAPRACPERKPRGARVTRRTEVGGSSAVGDGFRPTSPQNVTRDVKQSLASGVSGIQWRFQGYSEPGVGAYLTVATRLHPQWGSQAPPDRWPWADVTTRAEVSRFTAASDGEFRWSVQHVTLLVVTRARLRVSPGHFSPPRAMSERGWAWPSNERSE